MMHCKYIYIFTFLNVRTFNRDGLIRSAFSCHRDSGSDELSCTPGTAQTVRQLRINHTSSLDYFTRV